MSKTRRNHAPQFKAKVALEALAGEKTIHEIAAKHQVHPNQVTQWRRQLIDQAPSLFGKGAPGAEPAGDRDVLLAKIGQLTVEKDFSYGPCLSRGPKISLTLSGALVLFRRSVSHRISNAANGLYIDDGSSSYSRIG